MLRDLKYLIAYVAPLATYLAITLQGYWSFATVIVAFVLIPLIEQLAKGTAANPGPDEEARKETALFFDFLLYLNLPILLVLLWLYFSTVTAGGLATWETFGITLSMGIVMGTIGINVAHELGHRVTWYEQLMSKTLLTATLYNHFFIEHNRGHHKWVGTDKDPATARLGESLYLFWPRSISGSYLDAWKLEGERLQKDGKPVFSFYNEMVWFQIANLAYLALVWYFFGWPGVGFACAAAFIGILLLETVNYIEHYGLSRRLLPSGFYEKTTPRHSWNSDHEMGRIFLYELTRHSDHHFKATRKYQVLRHFDESPQLPLGYPASMLMAMLPPLWFRVMDERAKAVGMMELS
ncbi:MAG: alkane 1-monooxygenase [Saprospiraceae bacterium]